MTAGVLKGDREKCIEAGMDDFISKPVKIHDLVMTLEKFVNAVGPYSAHKKRRFSNT
jgi:CheY-like chemotaxis protein